MLSTKNKVRMMSVSVRWKPALSLALALMLVVGNFTMALAASATISGGGGSNWFIGDDLITTNGLPAGGFCTGGASGSGAGVSDASIPGQGDAFDFAVMAWVNNTQVGGNLSVAGTTATFSPVTIAGLTTQFQYYVLIGSSTMRAMLTLTNPTGSAVSVPVDYVVNYGSDGSTVINGTSSGDTAVTIADRWIVSNDFSATSGDPANTTVLYGPGAPAVTPASVSQTVFDCAGPQGVRATYNLTLPANSTRALLFYQKLDNSTANALAGASLFDTTPSGTSELIAGLSTTQLSQVVNWVFSQPNQPPTVAANSASVTVNEGQTAANTGTYSDSNAGDNVAISASVGAVTKTGTNSGTWSWSFGTNDGPAQSQTVTITANDGNGGITTTTFALTVDNVAPTASLGNNGPIDEGGSATVSFSSAFDPSSVDSASLHYAFDCSSGSLAAATYAGSGTTNSTSCSFADNGSYAVSGKIMDKDGGSNEYTTTVTVDNVAPTIAISGASNVNEGSPYGLTLGAVTDPGPDTVTAFIVHWGDGNSDSLLTHTYDDGPNNYNITVDLTDEDGTFLDRANALSVTVDNVSPTASLGNDGPIDEGSSANVFFSGAFDPSNVDSASLRYAFDCNGGSLAAATYAGSGTTNSTSCAFADNGSYTVSGKIMDKDDGSNEYTTIVTVDNVAPTITSLVAGAAMACGQSNSLTINFDDPALANDTYTANVDWGDGNSDTYSPVSSGFSPSHAYALAGMYTVSVTVSDEDGGTSAPVSTTLTMNFTIVGGGVQPPINQDGTSVFKYKSTIPVKLKVTDCNGSTPGALTIKIMLTMVSGATPGLEINEPISTSAADTSGFMRFSENQYIYNLATKPLPDPAATYKITLTIMQTGQTVTVNFGLKP